MEAADKATRSHIQRLPDEVLARLFIVGSWLPGRMSDHHYSESRDNKHPLQLKPYAKLVSQVCARWHDIVHWRSHGRQLYYAGISLEILCTYDTSPREDIVPVLKAYLDGIMNSEDAKLYVKWGFSSDLDEELVPFCLHGMNLTAPHFNRIRSLRVKSSDSATSAFCFSLLNSLGDDTVLTHLQIWDVLYSVPREPSLIPTCAAFNNSPFGSNLHPRAMLTALSHLHLIGDASITKKITIPANLLHLTLNEFSAPATWNHLWAVLLQCGSLRTLSIRPPSSERLFELPVKPAIKLTDLSELTLVRTTVPDMLTILPLLITLHLKYLYLLGLYDGDAETEVDSRKAAPTRPGSGMNSADSRAHSFQAPKLAAPSDLHIWVAKQEDMQTAVASLFASMSLEAVEILSFDCQDLRRPVRDANTFQTGYPLFGSPRSLAETILELFREHCSKPNDHAMPEVRITTSYGRVLLYSTLDHAESFITHED